jgi:hypothetical protein
MRRTLTALLVVAIACCVSGPAPAATPASTSTSGSSRLHLDSEQKLSFLYNQGVARVHGGWILSGTDKPLVGTDTIVRTDNHLEVLVRKQPCIPARWRAKHYDHVGDLDVVHGIVYAPLEQSDYSKGHQVTALYDAHTLKFLRAVVLPQHQNSFVTVDPKTMIAYTQDEFGGSYLRRYDVRHDWKRLEPLHMSRRLHHTQGADVARGAIWISTSDKANDIWRVSLATGHVTHLGTHGHPGGEGEGIDATRIRHGRFRGVLHTLVLDPAMHPVWFEQFSIRH